MAHDSFDTKASSIDIHGRRFVINSSVFARVLGISDLEDQISISEDIPNLDFWKSKFAITSRGIFLKDIEHCLEEMTTTDDKFKRIFFKQPTSSEGQYDAAAHGETSHANQGPVTGNKAHMKGIADVLQVVKEIHATLKTELHDIQTNVNLLYAKFSSAKDKNLDKDLHNTSSHQNSMHNMPPNPSPPPPSSQPLSIPTRQHSTVEVSSDNTRPLSKHQHTISKSTPS
ncbi:hypothetical protein Q3G72_007944 [Acer saccharum]|nr:hypothetical protein Q3G72_007944 [Acer saccharum]